MKESFGCFLVGRFKKMKKYSESGVFYFNKRKIKKRINQTI